MMKNYKQQFKSLIRILFCYLTKKQLRNAMPELVAAKPLLLKHALFTKVLEVSLGIIIALPPFLAVVFKIPLLPIVWWFDLIFICWLIDAINTFVTFKIMDIFDLIAEDEESRKNNKKK